MECGAQVHTPVINLRVFRACTTFLTMDFWRKTREGGPTGPGHLRSGKEGEPTQGLRKRVNRFPRKLRKEGVSRKKA